jgi:hypothetical protein
MIYIYGIVEQGCVLPAGLNGIDDTAPALLRHANIAAVIGDVQSSRVPLVEKNLWQHEKLIEGLMLDHAILPVRYGTLLKSEQEVLDILAANQAGFVSNLSRVRGRVELGVRVLWDDVPQGAPDVAASPAPVLRGRDYMLAHLVEAQVQRARRERGQALVDKINAVLSPLADQHAIKLLVTPRMLLTAAYLIAREHVGQFRNAIELLAIKEQKLQFMCTGPWPSYSFVDVNVQLPKELD